MLLRGGEPGGERSIAIAHNDKDRPEDLPVVLLDREGRFVGRRTADGLENMLGAPRRQIANIDTVNERRSFGRGY